jgi:uracil-DNA glycosylase family 4
VTRPVDAVIGFLEAEQTRGVTHVLLDEGARDGLRDLHRRAQAGSKPTLRAAAVQESPTPPPQSTPTAPATVAAHGNSKEELLASLRLQAESWVPAKALGTLRETMVFATGNPDARIMLVGEAPGHEEEKKREPFVGPAGQKLDDILRAMGLSRTEVYISNIVKFRPATARQTTNNRKPDPAEIAACLPFIRAEIGVVRPDCVIALGATAAEALLGRHDAVSAMRGSWHELEGVPLRVTYHPSHLLRSDADHAIKRMVWEDMLAVMDRLEMPVSQKQRRFFLPKS